MKLYPFAHFLHDAWLSKCWMDYDLAPWFDANDFSLPVVEAYADPDGYLLQSVHIH